MHRIDFTILRSVLVILVLAMPVCFLAAQDTLTSGNDGAAVIPALIPDQQATIPAIAELNAKRTTAAAEKEVDETTHAAVDQHYAKAIEHVQAAEQAVAQTLALKQELDGAPQRITEMQQELVTPVVDQDGADTKTPALETSQLLLKEREESLKLTTTLLYRVAEEVDAVLADPEPVVVFKEFGDSCLNFELRVFVNGLTTYRRLRHELHLAIDDLFREHHIEIAFPQRDLHLRSLPAELVALANSRNAKATSDSTEEVPIDQARAA